MGHFSYSNTRLRDAEEADEVLRDLAQELWGDSVEVLRITGVPIDKDDDRKAKWAFLSKSPEWEKCDAMFSIGLLKGGRMEFKLPVTDEGAGAQQKIRRLLVDRFPPTR